MNELSILILIVGVLSFGGGILGLICSLFIQDKSKVVKGSLYAILIGALLAIGGFTLCTATLNLGSMH